MKQDENTLTNVGCAVKRCRYNSEGRHCGLGHIEIKPCPGCGANDRPADESFCGSYEAK